MKSLLYTTYSAIGIFNENKTRIIGLALHGEYVDNIKESFFSDELINGG